MVSEGPILSVVSVAYSPSLLALSTSSLSVSSPTEYVRGLSGLPRILDCTEDAVVVVVVLMRTVLVAGGKSSTSGRSGTPGNPELVETVVVLGVAFDVVENIDSGVLEESLVLVSSTGHSYVGQHWPLTGLSGVQFSPGGIQSFTEHVISPS